MEYDKPFKTFNELVHYLETEHGLKIINGDAERKYISSILHMIPYYDLVNGYKGCFMENDQFCSDVVFPDLLLFYSFDRGFQNAIFPFSIMVEDYFKNILAYVIARDFGVHQNTYLDERHYVTSSGTLIYKKLHQRIRSIYESRKCDENGQFLIPAEYQFKDLKYIDEPTRHYVDHHDHIPPWILLKNVTFSSATNLFRLMKKKQKSEIAQLMIHADIPVDQKIQILIYALTLIRTCRNYIAHNLKFISFSAKKYSGGISRKALSEWIPRELVSSKELKHGRNISDIYAYIFFSLALIPDSFHKFLLLSRLSDYLQFMLDTNSRLPLWQKTYIKYIEATNLPLDLHNRLITYRKVLLSRVISQFPISSS